MILDSWFYFVSIKTEWCFCDYFCFLFLFFFYYVVFKVHTFPFQLIKRRAATVASQLYLFLSRKDYTAVKGCIVFPKVLGNNFTNGFTNESLNIALTSFNRQIWDWISDQINTWKSLCLLIEWRVKNMFWREQHTITLLFINILFFLFKILTIPMVSHNQNLSLCSLVILPPINQHSRDKLFLNINYKITKITI